MSSLKIDEVKVAKRGKKLEPLRSLFKLLKSFDFKLISIFSLVKFSHCNNPISIGDQGVVKSGIYADSLSDKEYVSVCQADSMCYMGNTKVENHRESLYIAIKNKVTNKVYILVKQF